MKVMEDISTVGQGDISKSTTVVVISALWHACTCSIRGTIGTCV